MVVIPEVLEQPIYQQREALGVMQQQAINALVDYAETRPLIDETDTTGIVMSTVLHTIQGLITTYPVYSVGLFY
jgi:hypothetical protein